VVSETNMGKNKFLIIGIGLIILIAIILVLSPPEGKEVNIITEKTEYQTGDALKINIENNLKETVCFSSCFPYYWEKKNGGWKGYDYTSCPDGNLIEKCIASKEVKAFELGIPSIGVGVYRLAIPACVGCNLKETFKENQWLYSNEFIIR